MSEKSLLLIDGGYLDFLQRSFGSPRLDYGRMANAVCAHFGWTLLRCVYFNCLPYLSSSPTPEEQEAYRKKEGFYQRLQKLDRFEVKLSFGSRGSSFDFASSCEQLSTTRSL